MAAAALAMGRSHDRGIAVRVGGEKPRQPETDAFSTTAETKQRAPDARCFPGMIPCFDVIALPFGPLCRWGKGLIMSTRFVPIGTVEKCCLILARHPARCYISCCYTAGEILLWGRLTIRFCRCQLVGRSPHCLGANRRVKPVRVPCHCVLSEAVAGSNAGQWPIVQMSSRLPHLPSQALAWSIPRA
jgi:hypothetical protein